MDNQDYNLKEDVFKWLKTYGLKRGAKKMHWPSIKFFHQEVEEYMEAASKRDEAGILLEYVDIMWQIENMAYYGVPKDKIKKAADYVISVFELAPIEEGIDDIDIKERLAFQAVSMANWSKICKSEHEARTSSKMYLYGEHPQKPGHSIETIYEQVVDYWVVKTPEGKGMKSYLSRNPRDIYNELLEKHNANEK